MKHRARRLTTSILPLVWAALSLSLPAAHADTRDAPLTSMPRARSCDRGCLYRVLDGYLEALRHQDPWRLNWAKDAVR